MVLDNPNGGLLNVGLLTSFSIQAYNDNTAVGAPIVNDPALLKEEKENMKEEMQNYYPNIWNKWSNRLIEIFLSLSSGVDKP